ncbi:MAG TPA: c-type cytochrome [Thermoanaerobaculia bacterium]|nr:c-type cytochrome [Thermoanaerobaculia bacterium]
MSKTVSFVATLSSAAALALIALGVARSATPDPQAADSTQARIERGHYLVETSGCHDCHTPWHMGPEGPEPDRSRSLSGHPQDFEMPPPPAPNGPWIVSAAATNTAWAGPWGISYTANLTPDELTGLGAWTEDIFVNAIRTGRHWGQSRPILPPMPWQVYSNMTDEDLKSVFAYLRSIPPIRNQVPDPVLAEQPVTE